VDNKLPGNKGTGIRIEAMAKIEKKVIINKPFKRIPSFVFQLSLRINPL